MKEKTAETLAQLNLGFYERNAESFSKTRQAPWPGWERVLDITGAPLSVLDIAAGNMRFQRYVNERFPDAAIKHYCVDSCESLAQAGDGVSFQRLDIAKCLYSNESLAKAIGAPECDLCTSFGFMHHIYGQDARIALGKAMLEKTRPAGHVAISFWRFADSANLHQKAIESTEQALEMLAVELEENDFLLGWDGIPGEFRYCHSFTDQEIEEFSRAMEDQATYTVTFECDGRTKRMNTYLVLARK